MRIAFFFFFKELGWICLTNFKIYVATTANTVWQTEKDTDQYNRIGNPEIHLSKSNWFFTKMKKLDKGGKDSLFNK